MHFSRLPKRLSFLSVGTAITLLHSNQVYDFNLVIQKTGREKIPEFEVNADELKSTVEKYQETLSRLQGAVKLEGQKKSKQQRRQQSMQQITSETVHEQITSETVQQSIS